MPIYEYICPVDGSRFEKILPISQSDESQECPKCGQESERVDSVPARRNPEYGIQR